jgi:hypothetical protein
MEVKVLKAFKNERDEDIFLLAIKLSDDNIHNINLTEKEYTKLVAALRSIDITEIK